MTDHVAASRKACEENGISWARAELPTMTEGPSKRAVHQWIEETERADRDALEARQFALATRSTDAAESSASAALESARTSGTSARAAMFAAFVSLLALIVSIAAYFKQP